MAGEWIPEKGREVYAGIFGSDFVDMGGDVLQGHCPGRDRHEKGSAATDCRVFLGYGPNGEKPGAFCLHNSCRGVLDDLNRQFRDRIFDGAGAPKGGRKAEQGVARKPTARESWIPDYDEKRLREFVKPVGVVGPEFFLERSPIDPAGVGPGEFLEHLFAEGERVMVFTDFRSQGDFLWEVGKGGFRMADRRGVKAVRSKLPRDGGKDGVWFLNQPVDGLWHANPRREGRFSRRSEEAVTRWRHLVLESDEAPPELWLALLARAPLAIRAIYSSGGRSWHALVDVRCESKADLDAAIRNKAKRILPIFGADPGAMTSVRLTRLPGCTRGGREQRLIWLNPKARESEPIRDILKVR